ncbi:metallopeptidase TldD-related protein [Pararobbsia silviterrae]|uniref:Metalloprotease PmbA n=1 Tax=Pararobbsia silviterrae TaxID=1792498 RepID=A0A494Y4M5_9BURK|nr:metallopeptidase TldD-related protein [Pararobbsia silviterrae]RKP57611.1 metalloprotease PmbA [Pararobbsia silviterrae]
MDFDTPPSDTLSYSLDALRQFATEALTYGKSIGAGAMSVEASGSQGRGLSVRLGALDTIKLSHDQRLDVTVYDGKRRGKASTADFSSDAIRSTVTAAREIARHAGADPFAGLPDEVELETSPRDLGLFHAWDIPVADAIALAVRAENAAFDADARVSQSSGASLRSLHRQRVLGMSNGFLAGFQNSSHSLDCAPIAGVGDDRHMSTWRSHQVDSRDLDTPEAIGKRAGMRAAAQVGARKLKTCRVPVLFESTQAVGLLGAFAAAINGTALLRRSSFLGQSFGTPVFADHVFIVDDPFIVGGLGSSPFDAEGVRVARRHVVEHGIVEGYLLSSYSARALGLRTTGNAGGPHNLTVCSTRTTAEDDLTCMLERLGTGLFVTHLLGKGVNPLTGDYSRGAAGFWVENGTIRYPVHEITIAGTLQGIFRDIVAIGNDVHIEGGLRSGSILTGAMTVAGR